MKIKDIIKIVVEFNYEVLAYGMNKQEKEKIRCLLMENPYLIKLCTDMFEAGKYYERKMK